MRPTSVARRATCILTGARAEGLKDAVLTLLARQGSWEFWSVGERFACRLLTTLVKPRLQTEVRRHVKSGATVITDELKSYQGLDQSYQHKVINHADRYVDGYIHTNGLENFWSLLKRGLSGTYVSVEPFHLFRYLDEQAYRYNKRGYTDEERVELVLGKVEGRRVTYKELNGKTKKPDPQRPYPRPVKRFPMGPF